MQRRTELLAKSVHLSRAKLYVNVPCSPSDLYKDKRATLNEKQENGTPTAKLSRKKRTKPGGRLRHSARSNNHVHDDFRYRNEQDGRWIFEDI